jgi:PAS domain S-box-containing protein
MLHSVLQDQVEKYLGNREIPEDFARLLGEVSRTYEQMGQQTNDDLGTLFRNIHEVVFSVDMRTNRLFQISAACEKVYGYTVEEFLSDPNLWFSLILEEDKQTIYKNDDILKRGQSVDEEYRIRHKNGEIRWLESRVDPTLNADGVLVRIDGITLDITKRKHYEAALMASNEELQKSNDELDRFVYSVSHDLRAPLASMLGAIEYSMSETHDKEAHYYLELIRNTAMKLDIFIQDILDYSRNARAEIKKEKIDFEELVSELSHNLKFMSMAKNGVAINVRVTGDAPFYSDSSRVNIILNNLVSNAIRYRDPNAADPFVEIRVRQTPSNAVLDIIDNGIGINPKFHDKVFDMFFRVSKRSEGSGLGLYIVKEALEKLDGTIAMESAPGKGTQFHIVLPNLVDQLMG